MSLNHYYIPTYKKKIPVYYIIPNESSGWFTYRYIICHKICLYYENNKYLLGIGFNWVYCYHNGLIVILSILLDKI